MRKLLLGVCAVLCFSCEEVECIECIDNDGLLFTFCDPAEPALDSLSCGEVFTKRK